MKSALARLTIGLSFLLCAFSVNSIALSYEYVPWNDPKFGGGSHKFSCFPISSAVCNSRGMSCRGEIEKITSFEEADRCPGGVLSDCSHRSLTFEVSKDKNLLVLCELGNCGVGIVFADDEAQKIPDGFKISSIELSHDLTHGLISTEPYEGDTYSLFIAINGSNFASRYQKTSVHPNSGDIFIEQGLCRDYYR